MSHKERVEQVKIRSELPDAVQGCPSCHGAGVGTKLHLTCGMCSGRGSVPAYKLSVSDQERFHARSTQ